MVMDVHSAFKEFQDIFLKNKKSIFSGENILTGPTIKYLETNFIKNGLSDKKDFIEKIKIQLIDKPKEKNDSIKNDAIEVLAHAVWLWRLSPSNSSATGRLKSVNEILELISGNNKIINEESDIYEKWFKKVKKGFSSAGTFYNINKPFELAYIINFFKHHIDHDLSNEELVTWVLERQTQVLFEQEKSKSVTKSVASQNALLHLLDKVTFLPILSNSHKEKIAKCFEGLLPTEDRKDTTDKKLTKISNHLFGENGYFEKVGGAFHQPNIRFLWDDDSSPIDINTIYYGSPGTGKTYLTKLAVESRVDYQNNFDLSKRDDQIRHVQFHPSFTYEDFIDGLKPQINKSNGQIELKLQDGVFKNFCHEATKTLKKYRIAEGLKPEEDREDNPLKYYFIVDEINRADLSAVFGEVLSCLEEDKRIDFDEEGILLKSSLTLSSQNSHLIKSSDQAIYTDNGKHKFGVPKNLVFIGTMNDIDRSVDTFDFALRRRFTWIHKGFDAEVLSNCDALKDFDLDEVQRYVDSCKKLNSYISNTLGLGHSYEIGHAYFMNIKVHGKNIKSAKENLFQKNIKPLLEEYLRSQYSAKDLSTKLKQAKEEFIGKSK
ncbi:MAG: AAA family ATPase [Prolixibacteraceae bacterium]|jgi:5-methylcytosine-specific restriction protein B|nr:AAA family ATPase [Prolixibacteraceae bacterium]